MAEDRAEPREVTWRSLLPWTELFRGFQIALDLNKLLLAAGGVVVTAVGWWLLALLFGAAYDAKPPEWNSSDSADWPKFKAERNSWNLMHRTAGLGSGTQYIQAGDVAENYDDYKAIEKALGDNKAKTNELTSEDRNQLENSLKAGGVPVATATLYARRLGLPKPGGELSTMPWSEDRGANPFMLVTRQVSNPWEQGHFWEWFGFEQAPVLVEPLVKFLRPIVYFFSPQADGYTRFYFLCVMVWTLAVWSLFGGAITRIAAVQIARNERIGMSEAIRFTMKRLLYYVTAPLFPLVFVLGLLIIMVIFGYFHMIPIFGDILVSGLFWWVMMGLGLLMAIALVGLVGWPLMSATISTEGTDSWEAVSRSYTYVFQKPWHYVWYGIVAISYGAVVVFFIGFMGSFTVYLSKWGVSQTPGVKKADREPAFLFVYAPTSFGWRTLLLDGVEVDGQRIVQNGAINEKAYDKYVGRDKNYQGKSDQLSTWNRIGAFLVMIWVGLLFLLVLGFGYSFFWSSATIIYLLMRKNVDTAELDEVYLEEDDQEGAYAGPLTAPAPATPTPAAPPVKTTQLQMVEAPILKAPTPEPAAPDPKPSPDGPVTPPS